VIATGIGVFVVIITAIMTLNTNKIKVLVITLTSYVTAQILLQGIAILSILDIIKISFV